MIESYLPVGSGYTVLWIVLIVYLLGLNYYLYKFMFNRLVQESYLYSKDFGPKLRVLFYCVITSIPLFAFTCFSILLSKTSTGSAATVSLDCCKIFAILGLIIYTSDSKQAQIQPFIAIRDVIFYITSLLVLILSIIYKTSVLGILLPLVYVAYCLFLFLNEWIKQKIYDILGLNNQDQLCNAEGKVDISTKKQYEVQQLVHNAQLISDQIEIEQQKHNRLIDRYFRDGNQYLIDLDRKVIYHNFGKIYIKIRQCYRHANKKLIQDRNRNYHKQIRNKQKTMKSIMLQHKVSIDIQVNQNEQRQQQQQEQYVNQISVEQNQQKKYKYIHPLEYYLSFLYFPFVKLLNFVQDLENYKRLVEIIIILLTLATICFIDMMTTSIAITTDIKSQFIGLIIGILLALPSLSYSLMCIQYSDYDFYNIYLQQAILRTSVGIGLPIFIINQVNDTIYDFQISNSWGIVLMVICLCIIFQIISILINLIVLRQAHGKFWMVLYIVIFLCWIIIIWFNITYHQ